MIRYSLSILAAASLTLAACGNGGSSAEASAASVNPSAVIPGDLQTAVSDERVKRFYETRNWAPAWDEENARALIEALDDAARHALSKMEFLKDDGLQNDPTAREAALSLAAISYADALADGATDPMKIRDVYTIDRPNKDLIAGLSKALERGEVKSWLAGLAPQDQEYKALSEAFLRYSARTGQDAAKQIERGNLIRPGEQDPRVPTVADALKANGYLAEAADKSGSANLYTKEMAAALKRMQEDYGIAADGIVGPDTIQILNSGPADRARQLAVNLERRRWLERNAPSTRIDVNTAAALLDYWRDGRHADHRRVVVGQPGWETPPLQSPLFRLVANPTWTVPKSIEQEEIAGKGEDYLRRNNMVRKDGWIVQQPGPDNALGQVKLDMRNDQAIYLHDTPAKSLFSRNQRYFSHGCVRVEDALGFARMVAQDHGVLDKFDAALATGEETFVDLPSNIPVRLLYHSAFVSPGGKLVFRTDPYGWDEDVARALGLVAQDGRPISTHIRDIGP